MDIESYLILLLADSNLPTGSFVASSGLESYLKHGFPSLTHFLEESLDSYARLALPFMSDAHHLVQCLKAHPNKGDNCFDKVVEDLKELDYLYESMVLNHVSRRASKSQGVALLTLYSKGFQKPPSLQIPSNSPDRSMERLVECYKRLVRKETAPGHLPLCFGVLTGALGLSLDRAQSLHLFLHARSLLSAAVRLNTIGPYNAQQQLLHVVKPLVDLELRRHRDIKTGYNSSTLAESDSELDEIVDGPANTWPLGEIISARHDLQHSRIFNS